MNRNGVMECAKACVARENKKKERKYAQCKKEKMARVAKEERNWLITQAKSGTNYRINT
jgi:hypothetical protein